MLSFTDPITAGRDPGVILFRDDGDPALFHTLVPGVVAEGRDGRFTGQLMMFGSGDPDRVEDVRGCFWSLNLSSAPFEPLRETAEAAVAREGVTPRFTPAVAAVSLRLELMEDPPLVAEATADSWSGGRFALGGDVPPEIAVPLKKAWRRGLRDARVRLGLRITGAEPPEGFRLRIDGVALSVSEEAAQLAMSTNMLESTETRAGQREIVMDLELPVSRRQARDTIILSGFD